MEITQKKFKAENVRETSIFLLMLKKSFLIITNGRLCFYEPFLQYLDDFNGSHNSSELKDVWIGIFEILEDNFDLNVRFPLNDKSQTCLDILLMYLNGSEPFDELLYSEEFHITYFNLHFKYNGPTNETSRMLIEHYCITDILSSRNCDMQNCTAKMWGFLKRNPQKAMELHEDHICFRFIRLLSDMVQKGYISEGFAYNLDLEMDCTYLKHDPRWDTDKPDKCLVELMEFVDCGYVPALQFVHHTFGPARFYGSGWSMKHPITPSDWDYVDLKLSKLTRPDQYGYHPRFNPDLGYEVSIEAAKRLEREGFQPPLGLEDTWEMAERGHEVFGLLMCEMSLNENSCFHKDSLGLDMFKAIIKVSDLFFLDPK